MSILLTAAASFPQVTLGLDVGDWSRLGINQADMPFSQSGAALLLNSPPLSPVADATGIILTGSTVPDILHRGLLDVSGYSNANTHQPGIWARMAFSSNNLTGYFAHVRLNTNGAHVLQIREFTGSFASTLQIGGNGTLPGTLSQYEANPFWIEMLCDGTTLSAKAWLDGSAEPGSYQINTTDASYTTGLHGVANSMWHSSSLTIHDYSHEAV